MAKFMFEGNKVLYMIKKDMMTTKEINVFGTVLVEEIRFV
jgi:hypothetical protein